MVPSGRPERLRASGASRCGLFALAYSHIPALEHGTRGAEPSREIISSDCARWRGRGGAWRLAWATHKSSQYGGRVTLTAPHGATD